MSFYSYLIYDVPFLLLHMPNDYLYYVLINIIDENTQALLKDPLHVPVGPITRARSKKIRAALNGLILQWGIPSLAQKKMKAS